MKRSPIKKQSKSKLAKAVKKAVKETRPAWKKITGGTHYHPDGQKVKVGEILYAEEQDLSPLVQKLFQRISPIKIKKKRKSVQPKKPEPVEPVNLEMEESELAGKYNVINPDTGEAVNDVPLTEREAISLISDQEHVNG